jgi:DNA-nicking Smr family endonuclease
MADKKASKAKPKAAEKDTDGKRAWARLTASANPLTGETRNRHLPTRAEKKSSPAKTTPPLKTKSTPPAHSPSEPRAPSTAPPVGRKPTPQDDLQLRTRRRLSRGTIALDGKIDLHGLTLAEAEAALAGFVKRAQSQHQIWLLVVTGKGARGEGKLRRALPEWLDRGALAGRVVEYGPAAPNHGGGGAFYLRLRRRKAR